MAAAKKDYEATLKKPKQSGVKVSAGDRQEDSAHAALLTLQAELRTLGTSMPEQMRKSASSAGICGRRRVSSRYWRRRDVASCLQEKSLLAHKDETLDTNASGPHLATRLRIRSA